MTSSPRIGFFPHNNSLFVLRHRGIVERTYPDVTWVDLRDLPQGERVDVHTALPTVHSDHLFTPEGYDVIGTGFTPPVTGLAAGHDLVYLGVSGPRVENGRLVVRADSDIRTVGDLRGRRVGIGHGSWQTTLLLLALDAEGLTWADVVPVDTNGESGAQGLADGSLDAWTGSYPELESVEETPGVRTLVETDGLFSHPSLWFTSRAWAEANPEALATVVEALQESDAWITANPREAAAIFVEDAARRAGTGETSPGALDAWEHALRGRPFGVGPVTEEFLDEQQKAADLLHRNGLLPRTVDVRAAVVPEITALVAASAARAGVRVTGTVPGVEAPAHV